MFYEVIPTRIFRQGVGVLTYSAEQKLEIGQIVLVPLGRSVVPGVVLRKVTKPEFKTKPIERVLYKQPLPRHLVGAAQWLADYYLEPLPQVMNLMLPVGVAKKRRLVAQPAVKKASKTEVPLNAEQKKVLRKLQQAGAGTQLLHGVTGSGKTHIYLHLAEDVFKKGKSTILLVPEIALTSQLVQVFAKTFGQSVVVLHSRQTEAERHLIWERILQADEPLVVVGARSALFAPLKNLGLIIIDEAHENTYFQENAPKYSAVRLASALAAAEKFLCVLGTATPLITDYYLAQQRKALISLPHKAKPDAHPPEVKLVDLKDKNNFSHNRYFSDQLLKEIEQNLDKGQQTLIFHNRRGSAPLTICENCGWQAMCPHCLLPLTLHADDYTLRCHTCGHQEKVPSSCPECKCPQIIHKGFGTKLLETELKRLFPKAKIARFDADNTKAETLDRLYTEVKDGKIDILVGTQTLTKGLDLPKLATVGIVQADAGLALPDFAADEHAFHLLTQVIGRIGRGHIAQTKAIIQTYQPENTIVQDAIKADYEHFADDLLQKRCQQNLPPFVFLAKIAIAYKTEATAVRQIRNLHKELQDQITENKWQISVSRPMPAFHEHTPQGYIWQLVLKAKSRAQLTKLLQTIPRTSALHLTLDPPSML